MASTVKALCLDDSGNIVERNIKYYLMSPVWEQPSEIQVYVGEMDFPELVWENDSGGALDVVMTMEEVIS